MAGLTLFENDSEPCFLLQLPSELLVTLADFLSPASGRLLSFTCRLLHNILNNDITKMVNKLSPHEYDDYLVAMVYGLGMHESFACVCHRLHRIEPHDYPGTTKRLAWRQCWPASAIVGQFANYNLHQRHVQLALRHSRSGARRTELFKFLRPYHNVGNSIYNPMSWEFSAQPVIADGSFLIHAHETFSPLYNSNMTMGQCQFLKLCPHVQSSRRWRTDTAHSLLRSVLENAFDQKGVRCDGSCNDCATDFSIMATDTGLELDVWYDFGADTSASSIWWTTHVTYSDGISEQDVEAFEKASIFPPGERKLRERHEHAMVEMLQ